jgi:ribosomal protein S12 methylthiotransferase
VPGVTLRTSFIVGFPGEDDAAFGNLVSFVREQKFDRVGVFTYSQEENTAAWGMPDQVPQKLKRARRAQMMQTQAQISLARNQRMIGSEVEVLIEGAAGGGRVRGRMASQAPDIDGAVFLRGEAQAGEFVRTKIERALTYDLHGQAVGVIN